MQEYFEIGQIVNTFGVKGFVKVKPFTDDLERFEELESILVVKNKDMIEMKIEEVKYQKNMVLLKLEGIDDMTMAEKYNERVIFEQWNVLLEKVALSNKNNQLIN